MISFLKPQVEDLADMAKNVQCTEKGHHKAF